MVEDIHVVTKDAARKKPSEQDSIESTENYKQSESKDIRSILSNLKAQIAELEKKSADSKHTKKSSDHDSIESYETHYSSESAARRAIITKRKALVYDKKKKSRDSKFSAKPPARRSESIDSKHASLNSMKRNEFVIPQLQESTRKSFHGIEQMHEQMHRYAYGFHEMERNSIEIPPRGNPYVSQNQRNRDESIDSFALDDRQSQPSPYVTQMLRSLKEQNDQLLSVLTHKVGRESIMERDRTYINDHLNIPREPIGYIPPHYRQMMEQLKQENDQLKRNTVASNLHTRSSGSRDYSYPDTPQLESNHRSMGLLSSYNENEANKYQKNLERSFHAPKKFGYSKSSSRNKSNNRQKSHQIGR